MFHHRIELLPRMGICEAARVFGMTARALRYYETRGLLTARRDRFNARFYEYASQQRLAWIAALREAGVGLAEIEEILESSDDGTLRARAKAALETREQALEQEQATVRRALARIAEEVGREVARLPLRATQPPLQGGGLVRREARCT
jgi:DNA-binding transcriptional MerR regulator